MVGRQWSDVRTCRRTPTSTCATRRTVAWLRSRAVVDPPTTTAPPPPRRGVSRAVTAAGTATSATAPPPPPPAQHSSVRRSPEFLRFSLELVGFYRRFITQISDIAVLVISQFDAKFMIFALRYFIDSLPITIVIPFYQLFVLPIRAYSATAVICCACSRQLPRSRRLKVSQRNVSTLNR